MVRLSVIVVPPRPAHHDRRPGTPRLCSTLATPPFGARRHGRRARLSSYSGAPTDRLALAAGDVDRGRTRYWGLRPQSSPSFPIGSEVLFEQAARRSVLAPLHRRPPEETERQAKPPGIAERPKRCRALLGHGDPSLVVAPRRADDAQVPQRIGLADLVPHRAPVRNTLLQLPLRGGEVALTTSQTARPQEGTCPGRGRRCARRQVQRLFEPVTPFAPIAVVMPEPPEPAVSPRARSACPPLIAHASADRRFGCSASSWASRADCSGPPSLVSASDASARKYSACRRRAVSASPLASSCSSQTRGWSQASRSAACRASSTWWIRL